MRNPTPEQAARMIDCVDRITEAMSGIRHALAEAGLTSCCYCGAEVDHEHDQAPAVDDSEAWAELSTHHVPGCEWVETRAHRLGLGADQAAAD